MKTTKCSECGQDFTSRNKLFKHLNDSGHGAASQSDNAAGGAISGEEEDGNKEDADGRSLNNNNKPHLAKGNDAYYEYYLLQNICKGEKSWKEAYHRLRTPLPVSYRIHESSPISEFSVQLLELIEQQNEFGGDGRKGMMANNGNQKIFQQWSFSTDNNEDSIPKLRMTITPHFHHRNKSNRKSNKTDEDEVSDNYSPILHALQELGAIHRQELVSAIPPLVLWAASSKEKDEKNDGWIVADLCAAPGSKSLQMLDMLYTDNTAGKNSSSTPSGLLVVNDSDRNRIITLCQRSRHVPRAPMLAINMDARYFPGMRRRCNWSGAGRNNIGEGVEGAPMNVREKAGYKQKYDKVLCDVPCSGDGTTRKNRQVWNTWSISHAMSLHRLQRKILRRAMELLRPGGVVVYSTCSLNPLEDEAVVASVIEDVGGANAMEIVPLPDWLVKNCGALNGLKGTWQVPNPKFGKNGMSDMYKSFDDVSIEHQGGGDKLKGKKGGQINRSMFPPDKDSALLGQLGNCGRFVPSTGLDSGGFFVACIRRLHVGELGSKERTSPSVPYESSKTPVDEPKQNSPATTNEEGDKMSQDGDLESSTTGKCLREGDWICASCKEVNFGRRGGLKCFSCKARKPRPLQEDKEDEKIHKPLLGALGQSDLDCFLQFFGIQTRSSFPLDNCYLIRRAKESVIVVVSESLSKLNISESWSPVREVGITLAAFSNETQETVAQNHNFRLFDEGLPILASCATRRHFQLQPVPFQNALAQSVRLLLKSSSASEVERVKATLDRSLPAINVLCESDMWHDKLSHSMASMWALCKAEPGDFIVSCECKIPNRRGSIGLFSFCGCIDAEGNVTVKSSLRVAAALLVVLHKYSECSSKDLPVRKRRRV